MLIAVALFAALAVAMPAAPDRPAEICLAVTIASSSFEPTQGVWQDDSGANSFADKPGKRLTITSPLQATAELDMVENRPTLLFGTERPGGDRKKITITVLTGASGVTEGFIRFKLSQNGGAPTVLYETPPGVLPLGPPCDAPLHPITLTVPTPTGIPPADPPFQFTETGPYRLTAVLVEGGLEITQARTEVTGQVDATHPPHFELIPATITNPAPDGAAQATVKTDADNLAKEIVGKLASYMPIPITSQVKANATRYEDFDLTKGPPVRSAFVQAAFRLLRVPVPQVAREASFQRLIDDLGLATLYYGRHGQYDRTIVVMRPADFTAAGLSANTQALSATQKVIFVKDDSSQYTVGHEFSHTLPYLWSRVQMLAECDVNYHNVDPALQYAHGYQLFDRVSVATGAPHYSRAFIDLPSIMESTTETERQWLDQCTYRNDLQQLRNIPDPRVILVSGLVAQRGARAVGMLLPSYELTSQLDLAAHAGGKWAIVLRGSRNRVLGRFPFTPTFGYDEPRVRRIIAAIQYRVPALPGVRAVDLEGPGGRLDRLVFGARPPRVALRASVAPPHAGPRRMVRVSWRGQAFGGRSLLYTLLDSANGGRTWTPVFIERGLRAARLSVPRRSTVVVKLIATDGSQSATAQRTIAVGP